jgi:dye decolorizing peroxidase
VRARLDTRRGPTRRTFIIGGAVAGVGAVAAIGVDAAASAQAAPASTPLNGDVTVPFYGTHQAGIDTDAQAHASLIALDLRPDVDRDGTRRLLRTLTDDAARLTRGEAALADTEPELATAPARPA